MSHSVVIKTKKSSALSDFWLLFYLLWTTWAWRNASIVLHYAEYILQGNIFCWLQTLKMIKNKNIRKDYLEKNVKQQNKWWHRGTKTITCKIIQQKFARLAIIATAVLYIWREKDNPTSFAAAATLQNFGASHR